MRRRTLLGLAGPLVVGSLAGCSGDGSSTSSCPTRRVTPVPYPDPPSPLTTDTAVSYLIDVERAYQTREHDDGSTVDISLGVAESTVESAPDGVLASMEVGFSTQDCRDGVVGAGGGSYRVRYYANETVVYRSAIEAKEDGGRGPPDPREDGVRLVG